MRLSGAGWPSPVNNIIPRTKDLKSKGEKGSLISYSYKVKLDSLGGDVDDVHVGAAVVVPAAQLVRLGQVGVEPQHRARQVRQRLAAVKLS